MATVATQAIVRQVPLRILPYRRGFDIGLREVWAYRELLVFFVWRDVKIRYKQTVIGASWALLQPFLTMLVFSLIFGRLAKLPTNGLPYPVFYYCALLPWSYFATGLQNATNAMVEQQRLITKIYFPRLVLPVSAVLSGLIDFAVAFAMLIALMVYYRIVPGSAALLLPGFLLLAILTALGFGLWLSALNAIYRDVRYIVPFLVQFWMFVSPVAYSSSLVPQRWHWIYGLNPMAGVIEGFRWALTGHGVAPRPLFAASVGGVLLVLLGGLLYFRSVEGTIADIV
jgi:homopolymeric O-antigen transport system permease protein